MSGIKIIGTRVNDAAPKMVGGGASKIAKAAITKLEKAKSQLSASASMASGYERTQNKKNINALSTAIRALKSIN